MQTKKHPITGPRNWRRKALAGVFVAVGVGLSGCVVTTAPFSETDRRTRIQTDLGEMFADQEPLSGPISLEESLARALKYNLDHKIELMESIIANRHVDVARMDLLPRVAASAGYTHRSNSAGGRSQSLLTGEESLEPSTSQERDSRVADLQVAWNVLDFGVSYVSARQRQDEARMIEERRRKVIQNISFEVVNAFSLAWIAQRYGNETKALISEINEAIDSYDRLIDKQLQNPKEALLGQRRLLDTQNQLLELADDMAVAQTRLARLMNLKPGKTFTLGNFEIGENNLDLVIDIESLEMAALELRPELREEDYAKRVSELETRKELLRMFPGLEFSIGGHTDRNKFLFNRSWADTGLRLSWNLFNLVNGPGMRKLRKSEEELADARRLALSMSVMTQVRLAAQNYAIERKQFSQAKRLARVDNRLYDLVKGAKLTRTRFDMIQAKAAWLTSTIRKEVARAEIANAQARIMDSLGADPLPIEVESHSVESLTAAIRQQRGGLMERYFSDNSPEPQQPQRPRVVESTQVIGRDDGLLSEIGPELPAYDKPRLN